MPYHTLWTNSILTFFLPHYQNRPLISILICLTPYDLLVRAEALVGKGLIHSIANI